MSWYVYKYIDIESFNPIYIGITQSIYERHRQHKTEQFYKENESSIVLVYAEVKTKEYARFFEQYLISKYFHDGHLLNKDNHDFFIDDLKIKANIEWKIYLTDVYNKPLNYVGGMFDDYNIKRFVKEYSEDLLSIFFFESHNQKFDIEHNKKLFFKALEKIQSEICKARIMYEHGLNEPYLSEVEMK